MNLDAVLRIKAQTQGAEGIAKLRQGLEGASAGANKAVGAFGRLKGLGGAVGGVLRQLVPALTVGGMAALAKSTLDQADALAKMSSRTGVSVEMLDKFQQAADLSDTSIDTVQKGLQKLSQNMAAAQNPTSAQAKLFEGLGISVTDANGKLRDSGAVLLDVANKFKAMPDGPEKTALAMQLLGKAGVEMIPMLNMGGDAIDSFKARFSTEFAKAAEAINDAFTEVGREIGRFAMSIVQDAAPAIEWLTGAVKGAADSLQNMPEPMRQIISAAVLIGGALALVVGVLGLVVGIVAKVAAGFAAFGKVIAGLKIGATIAGWAGAILPALAAIGGAIKAFLVVAVGLVSWPVLVVAALVAAAVAIFVFRDKIWEGIQAVTKMLWGWVESLWALGEPVRQFWGGLWESLKGFATGYFSWLASAVKAGFDAVLKLAYQVLVEPWVVLWTDVLQRPVTSMITWLGNTWKTIAGLFKSYVITPLQNAWNGLTKFIGDAISAVVNVAQSAWNSLANGVTSVLRGVLQAGANMINGIIRILNSLIDRVNQVRGALGMSAIGRVSEITIPAFAKGGIVDRPTLAMVGEREREYIVPESKMAGASARFLAGVRGADVIPTASAGRSGVMNQQQTPVINITTGPVMEFDGKRYVRIEDFDRGLRQVADGVIGRLRTPAARIALGRV
jgi:hypothetical protein